MIILRSEKTSSNEIEFSIFLGMVVLCGFFFSISWFGLKNEFKSNKKIKTLFIFNLIAFIISFIPNIINFTVIFLYIISFINILFFINVAWNKNDSNSKNYYVLAIVSFGIGLLVNYFSHPFGFIWDLLSK